MLRRKQPESQPSASNPFARQGMSRVEQVIALEEFRPALVAPLISRWQILPVNDPVVKANPSFFRGLVRLDEEVD
jgi:hypothetical protein